MGTLDIILIDGLSFAMPLFIIAIGGIYSEKSGVIMLSLEGLQGFGTFVGAAAVVIISHYLGPSASLIYISMLAAMIGGAFFSMLHAVLCIYFRARQVISGVVVNILAVALTTFLTSIINSMLTGARSNRFLIGVSPRFTVPGLSQIPLIGGLFMNMYPFVVIIVVIAIITWYILYKTRYGLRLRACGENPHSLDAAGGNVSRIRFSAVMICGALAGLGGMSFAYSVSATFSPAHYMGFGFLAIAALIFGNWSIMPTFAVCMFFGMTRSAGYQLIRYLGLPGIYSELFMILPYVLTLLLLVFFSKHNHPPRAIGEFFDKGKR